MHFKIISTGWNCGDFIYPTFYSILDQTHQDWHCHIVDDASDYEQQQKIAAWCAEHDDRWSCEFHGENLGVVQSQYYGVRAMDPADEDVIVYLDMDGDCFAHPKVLEHLEAYYSNETLMTYGSYRPIPDPGGPVPVSPYPAETVRDGSYRRDTREQGVRFNHLRTMKWKVLKEVPESYYQWPDGEWLFSGSDYVVMMGCLEIAGGHYRCLDEVLMYYNAKQPSPDNVRHPAETARCSLYALTNFQPLAARF